MSRGLSTAQNQYLAGNSFLPITLIHISVYGGSDIYYTDAPFDIDYASNTYQAQGQFLGISESSETADLQITSINLVISALDLSTIQTLGTSTQINQTVKIWRGYLDPTDNSFVADSAEDPTILIFQGKIAGYRIENATESAQMVIEVSSQFANFNRTSGRKTNLANIQREHSTDFGMEYSHVTLNDIKWGKK